MHDAKAAFQSLDQKLKRAQLLGSISSLLEWDEQVNLPEGCHANRQDQSAALSAAVHEATADPEVARLLDFLESQPSTPEQAAVLKHARRQHSRAANTPAEWVERHARLCSQAYHAWAKARASNDFATFAPYLKKHVALAKERAAHLGWADRPYDLQIDLHDPGVDAAFVEALFAELRSGLVPLAQRILDAAANAPSAKEVFTGFPIHRQKAFLAEVTAALGFDYQRGRIDVSLHPFCSGNGADVRMTTRFHENNPLDSLFSSIHEAGHGIYEQGLPLDQLHTALGQAAGMGVHESQSRLWENQVSRSQAFWRHYEPKFRATFPELLLNVTSDELYRSINSVARNPIRVDADEVTYNLHIIIRFEIEKKLFSGELQVEDLPAHWNDQYESLLGIRPRDDAEGVLQDIHWSGGAFGYFPSYCLGNMLAAQLWYAALDALPGLEDHIAQGNFSRLFDWLRQNVHQHGARYPLGELAQIATGQPLSPKALLRYLEERYLPLYP